MPQQKQKPTKGSGAGHKPGEAGAPAREKSDRAQRPVEEEDTFGGAERTQKGKRVSSKNAKP